MSIVVDPRSFRWYIERDDHRLPLMFSEHIALKQLQLLATPDSVFIDVGAHVGKYTVPMACLVRRVIAIEPNPRSVEVLRKNLELNNIRNVDVVEACVSDVEEEVELHDLGGSSSIVPPYPSTTRFRVRCYPLPRLLGNVDRIDIVKIDVEGYEEKVVRGALDLFKRFKPYILVEHHEFWRLGYRTSSYDAIRSMLSDWVPLFVTDSHVLYVPRHIDVVRNREKFVYALWNMAVKKVLNNIASGKPWYYGLPGNWWWGCSFLEFVTALPERIPEDEELARWILA